MPADFEVQFSSNAKEVITALQRRRVNVLDVLRPAFHRSGLGVEAAMKPYPPPPSGSRYVRTGRLGRTWTTNTRTFGETIVTSTGNVTRYARYVQAEGQQARVHRGRWQTDELVLTRRRGAIEGNVSSALRSAL